MLHLNVEKSDTASSTEANEAKKKKINWEKYSNSTEKKVRHSIFQLQLLLEPSGTLTAVINFYDYR